MSTLERYTFEDADGTEQSWVTFDAVAAREHGEKYGLRVIAHTYEWADSEVAWDFTDTEPDDDGDGGLEVETVTPPQQGSGMAVVQVRDVETGEQLSIAADWRMAADLRPGVLIYAEPWQIVGGAA